MVNCTEIDPWGNPKTFQCTHGCCLGESFIHCCSSNGYRYEPKTWQPDLPGHVIAAVTAGCVLGVVVVVGVVYAMCRHAKNKDKFLEDSIKRLRVPPGRNHGRVTATTKMFPGPRRDVISIPTYTPRDLPQLTSTPISSPAVPDPVPTQPPRRVELRSWGNKKSRTKKNTVSTTGGTQPQQDSKPRLQTSTTTYKDSKNSQKTGATEKPKGSKRLEPAGNKNIKQENPKKMSTFRGKKVK